MLSRSYLFALFVLFMSYLKGTTKSKVMQKETPLFLSESFVFSATPWDV